MNAPGLDRRELDDGCMEGVPIFTGLSRLLRGQRRVGHVGLKAVISAHGTLAMILLVAFVAVTQAATNERVTVISSDASRMTRSVKWG